MDSSYSIDAAIQARLLKLVERLTASIGQSSKPEAVWIREGQRVNSAGPAPATSYSAQPGFTTSASAGAGQFDAIIREVSQRYEVDPALVRAVIRAESNFNPRRSPRPARWA